VKHVQKPTLILLSANCSNINRHRLTTLSLANTIIDHKLATIWDSCGLANVSQHETKLSKV